MLIITYSKRQELKELLGHKIYDEEINGVILKGALKLVGEEVRQSKDKEVKPIVLSVLQRVLEIKIIRTKVIPRYLSLDGKNTPTMAIFLHGPQGEY